MKSELNTSYAILSIVDAVGGELRSRTTLQKISYFVKLGGIINADFNPHYYGPYSSEISSKTAALESLGLLQEKTILLGPQPDPWLAAVSGDVKTYAYTLTSQGKKAVQDVKKNNAKDWQKLNELVGICGRINFSPGLLATAAKVHFIISNSKKRLSIDDTKRIAKDFGWVLTDEQILKVSSFLKDVRNWLDQSG